MQFLNGEDLYIFKVYNTLWVIVILKEVNKKNRVKLKWNSANFKNSKC